MARFRSPPAGTQNADLYERIAELDERLRVQDQWRRELEQRVKELEAALSDTPCLCIGPRPSVDEGTMCSRCAALEGGKQDE